MTEKTQPTDAELKAMWQLHAADIGGIFYYARAVLAKWGQPSQAAEPVARLEIESLNAQLHAAKQINAAQIRLLAASIPGSALRASHGQAPATQQVGEPECYKWEHYCRWGHGWGWGECESEYDPRLPENKQYHTEDFNDPEQVRNFRALYRHTPPSLPTAQADSVQEERERICAAIKVEDDYCVEQGDYMLDSDDCIKIARGDWVRPDFSVDAARKQGENHD